MELNGPDGASQMRQGLPSPDEPKDKIREAGSLLSQNPLGLVLGSLAVGFLAGLLVPVSDIERERVGPIGEKMADKARAAAAGLVEQGRGAVADAVAGALGSNGSQGSSSIPTA